MKNKEIIFILLIALSIVGPAMSSAADTTPAILADGKDNPLPAGFAGDYLAGQFARTHGDIASAVEAIRRARIADPDNLDLARQLQAMLLLRGRTDEAVSLANDILQMDDEDQLSGLLLTLRDIKNNSPDKASETIDSVTPDNGNVQLWQPLIGAWLDLALGKLDKPVPLESLSADVTRTAPLVNYHLALIHSAAGFVNAAADNFKSAIGNDPAHAPARVMWQLLRFYRVNGQPAKLKPIVEAWRKAHPDEVSGDVAAIDTVQEGTAEILYTMGGIMLGAGVSNDAAIYLQLALFVEPHMDDAALGLGDAYAELGKYELSNASYQRIAASSPLYMQSQLRMAVNDDRMGNLKDAMAKLDSISVLTPDNPDPLVAKGDLLRIHARYSEAADAYSTALGRVPMLTEKDWPVLFARASCLERQGKWPAAEEDLQHALTLYPDQPDVLNYLGYGWLEHGTHLSQARALIEKAVKARPNDAQIVDSMGWALYLSGDYQKATDYLEKAVEMLPGDPYVNDHLGDVYWRLGRKTEARYQWERSLTFSTDTRLTGTIRNKLESGLPPTAMANRVSSDTGAKAADATP